MDFRTPVDIGPFASAIDHRMKGLALGSCFADSMGRRMTDAKFDVLCNPFGVLFNPASIADAVEDMAAARRLTAADLELHDGLWSCFSFHGSHSSTDPARALDSMNAAVARGRDYLERAEYVLVTFGTAAVWELSGGGVAANCHKFPASRFTRRMLGCGEIVRRWSALIEGPLRDKHLILTVSPVRHLGDGAAANTLSKATLNMAVHELAASFPGVDYFPAFEIMNDELRDYRFYGDDMVHPSPMAVEYIWEAFCRAAFDGETRKIAARAEKIAAAMRHRPTDPDSARARAFRRTMLEKVRELQRSCPWMDLSAETGYFSK